MPVELPALAVSARSNALAMWDELPDQDVLLWVDNWYWERFGTSPDDRVLSQNVTAMGVLFLTRRQDVPAMSTRSQKAAAFPGHLSLFHLTLRVDAVTTFIQLATDRLLSQVTQFAACEVQSSWIRVPLDVARPRVRSLRWSALSLSESTVSSNVGLLEVLDEVRMFQRRVGRATPLLVDEKIHYSVCRMLYARSFSGFDMGAWLRQVPLLYGVWHPYKQTLHVVYRAFFPIFALLHSTRTPVAGATISCQRKVIYLEKLFGAMLLAAPGVRGTLVSSLAQARRRVEERARAGLPREPEEAGTLELLLGLESLVNFFLPAVFTIGHKVRSLTWEGQPGGTQRGDAARVVLEQCLVLHLALQRDFGCHLEYTRTLSVALLTWQPWMSSLPGCCFVEESCEAMLSRLVARCRGQRQVTGFLGTTQLFVTLPQPSGDVHSLQGGIQDDLVVLFRARLRALLSPDRDPLMFANVTSAKTATWQSTFPETFTFPRALHGRHAQQDLAGVLRCALTLVSAGRPLGAAVQAFLTSKVPAVAQDDERASRLEAQRRTQRWVESMRRSPPAPLQTTAAPSEATSSRQRPIIAPEGVLLKLRSSHGNPWSHPLRGNGE
jgi:hypothetical protein